MSPIASPNLVPSPSEERQIGTRNEIGIFRAAFGLEVALVRNPHEHRFRPSGLLTKHCGYQHHGFALIGDPLSDRVVVILVADQLAAPVRPPGRLIQVAVAHLPIGGVGAEKQGVFAELKNPPIDRVEFLLRPIFIIGSLYKTYVFFGKTCIAINIMIGSIIDLKSFRCSKPLDP